MEFRCGACANGDACAFAGEFFRNGASQPFAGRRDDGYAAFEPQIHFRTPFKTAMVSRNGQCVKLAESERNTGSAASYALPGFV